MTITIKLIIIVLPDVIVVFVIIIVRADVIVFLVIVIVLADVTVVVVVGMASLSPHLVLVTLMPSSVQDGITFMRLEIHDSQKFPQRCLRINSSD